jgi:hypothetical protein
VPRRNFKRELWNSSSNGKKRRATDYKRKKLDDVSAEDSKSCISSGGG